MAIRIIGRDLGAAASGEGAVDEPREEVVELVGGALVVRACARPIGSAMVSSPTPRSSASACARRPAGRPRPAMVSPGGTGRRRLGPAHEVAQRERPRLGLGREDDRLLHVPALHADARGRRAPSSIGVAACGCVRDEVDAPVGAAPRPPAAWPARRRAGARPSRPRVDAARGELVRAAGPRPSASGTGWRCRGGGCGGRRWRPIVVTAPAHSHLTGRSSDVRACAACRSIPAPRSSSAAASCRNRVDDGADRARARRPDRRGRPPGRRRHRRRRIAGKVLAALDSVRVVSTAVVALPRPRPRSSPSGSGADDVRHTMYTTPGGNTPAVARQPHLPSTSPPATLDVVLDRRRRGVAHPHGGPRAPGGRPTWTRRGRRRRAPTRRFGGEFDIDEMVHPLELARGVLMPVQVYPVFESRAAGRRRRHARRVGRAPRRGCGRASARWRRPTRTPGSSEAVLARGGRHARRPTTA